MSTWEPSPEQIEAACSVFWEEWPLPEPFGEHWTESARGNMANALRAAHEAGSDA